MAAVYPCVLPPAGRALREAISHPDLRGPAEKAGLSLRPGSADDLARLIQSQPGGFAQAIKDAKVPLES